MNKLIIAAAGSGKTTYLVRQALEIRDKNVLITTYTEANKEEIERKFISEVGCIPSNISIQTWFSFLLRHGVRPYQTVMHEGLDGKRIGFFLTEAQSGLRYKTKTHNVYWAESDFFPYYFTTDLKIYSDKISKFIVECNARTKSELVNRISRIYPYIFIDEVQDLAGWELEILKLLFATPSHVLLVGDPRQVTYLTHPTQKYTKYQEGKIGEFIKNECKISQCDIDTTTLNMTHRNNKEICDFSSRLFPEYIPCEPCECEKCRDYTKPNEGVFLIREKDVDQYLNLYSSTILKYKDANPPEWNFGKSKGLTFDRVLIYPTSAIIEWLKNHSSQLSASTRCKFYVAVTRARYSVGIVCYESEIDKIGHKIWEPPDS